jgi:hypothetical protein
MRPRAVLLAVVLVLAGCSTFGGPSDPGETVTPAPVPSPETPTPTETPEPDDEESVPPLTLAAGTEVSADRLARNHLAALRNRSYRMTTRHHRVVTVNGTVTRRVVQTERIWVVNATYRYDIARTTTAANSTERYNRSVYADENGARMRVDSNTGSQVFELDAVGGSERFAAASAERVRRYLTNPEQSVIERDGRFLIRGEGSSHPDQTFTTNNVVRAVVEPNGLVRSLTASYEERARVGPRQVTESFTVVDAERVPEPDWLNGTES